MWHEPVGAKCRFLAAARKNTNGFLFVKKCVSFFLRAFDLDGYFQVVFATGLGKKRDTPNICDDPDITLGSKNKCGSGSGDSPRAATCGPGSSRCAAPPVEAICHNADTPIGASRLPSIRTDGDTLVFTQAVTLQRSATHLCIVVIGEFLDRNINRL